MMTVALQTNAQQAATHPAASDTKRETQPDAATIKAELRRQMYERIAHGHALNEVEAQAQNKARSYP